MKILLINPIINKNISKISSFFPAGISYIGSYLQSNNFDVEFLDLQTIAKKKMEKFGLRYYLKEKLTSFKPDIVGIGCLFSHYFPNAKKISKELKSINPKLLIVLGGLHPTLFCRDIMEQTPDIDFIILGEGEKSFLSLCEQIKEKSKKYIDIDGLAFRDNNKIIINPKTKYIDNLDELPFPSFDKIAIDQYVGHLRYNSKNRGMSILTSRSCPNKCTFCSMFHSHGSKWRSRSAENVLEEIEILYKKYNIRNFQFMDDNMTFSKKRTMEIFSQINKRGMKITFSFPNGIAIKTLDYEVLSLMKDTGCLEIRLPIESGSEYMRNKIMKKRLSNEKIFEVIEVCNKLDMPTIGYFIVGMPGEDHTTMKENFDFVKQLRGPYHVDFMATNFATPYPGTALFKQCIEEKLIDEETIQQLIDGTGTVFDKPIIKLKTLSESELIEYRKKMLQIAFKQSFFPLLKRYGKPTKNNFRIFKALVRRFVFEY